MACAVASQEKSCALDVSLFSAQNPLMDDAERLKKNAYRREWRKKNLDKANAYQKAWLDKEGSRDWVRAYNRAYGKKRRAGHRDAE